MDGDQTQTNKMIFDQSIHRSTVLPTMRRVGNRRGRLLVVLSAALVMVLLMLLAKRTRRKPSTVDDDEGNVAAEALITVFVAMRMYGKFRSTNVSNH